MSNPPVADLHKPLLILIAGPYQTGTNGDPEKINRARLERFGFPIYQRGYLPMVAEWMALPIIYAAGGMAEGDETDVSELPQQRSNTGPNG